MLLSREETRFLSTDLIKYFGIETNHGGTLKEPCKQGLLRRTSSSLELRLYEHFNFLAYVPPLQNPIRLTDFMILWYLKRRTDRVTSTQGLAFALPINLTNMNCAVERNYNGSHNRWQIGQIQCDLGKGSLEEKCRNITLNTKEYIYDDRRIIKFQMEDSIYSILFDYSVLWYLRPISLYDYFMTIFTSENTFMFRLKTI